MCYEKGWIISISRRMAKIGSLKLNVDAKNGANSAECGNQEKTPCKTLKQAIANSLPERPFSIYTTEECNKYDTEPITIEAYHIEIKGKDDCRISLTNVLDETKVQQGESLFNLKKGGYLELCGAKVIVDTARKSGRDNGLFVCDGEDAKLCIYRDNITSTDSNQALNCILIECNSGVLNISQSIFEHFSSACAFILAANLKEIHINNIVLDSISTTSDTQSVFTILSGCQKIYLSEGKISNCNSIGHKIGGALYVEIGDCKSYKMFNDLNFANCSCRSGQASSNKRYLRSNEVSKGGAMYIKATDETTEQFLAYISQMTFANCSADKGQHIFISVPVGREQISNDMFYLEMNNIYGKENLILLEERKNGERKIIDLLSDEENRLPYHSSTIYVGGDESSENKECGRMEEPCDMISTGFHHAIQGSHFMMLINGRVCMNEPLKILSIGAISSVSETSTSSNSPFSTNPSCGTIRIGAKMEAGASDTVFEISYNSLHFKHIDFEYPDAIEGDALDLIYARNKFQMNDVVFRPWYTGLTGENVLGGEGKMLPYKLFNFYDGYVTVSQLVIYGRNGNITEKCHHCNNLIQNNDNFLKKGEIEPKFGTIDRIGKEDNPLCLWDSGLFYIRKSIEAHIDDSTFADISDGAILSDSSDLRISNCSFINNHPTGENWEKYHSIRHSIRQSGEEIRCNTQLDSLTPGSDGLDGKLFGMISDIKASGTAAENMDSYFFSPILKNVTLKWEDSNQKNEQQIKKENKKEIEAVVHGSYLFPCGLTFEASKKKKGKEMIWADCYISEYSNETYMKAKIPSYLFNDDDCTSFAFRFTYSYGIIRAEKKRTASVMVIIQKKDKPNKNNSKKLTKEQLFGIIVSVSVFVVAAIVTVVAVTVCVVRKNRRHYMTIRDYK
ncbi:uncharacterized protein MONOS_7413 [Monocercomonoides exilis]|uniref:uncharacterized protein n=1 Tax=Monocercomonoides exilis TaxID=2049356 RepID=UPI0035596D34|nr:hypothetical protein MONOS_7413 [Monocercomonoides exilis]|eukprot:MONOS_7413.1-p1 / transcript=MONOS_7413.1 / gene=MONOS_7413 / organism=Monocercomonoides_exilis_PA203 / gene_product=unspecified product / transcript_product=unspecified product / location=Mono_scaffold00252:53079-55787(-) / protein_length=903 / sequence_SO=supercontig / SO=protein_coding / is_pseudo=false